MIKWEIAKTEREKRRGSLCEVCHKKRYEIGHHRAGRKFQKANDLEVWQLCHLRCHACETEMHRLYRTGNTPEDEKRINNLIRILKAPD